MTDQTIPADLHPEDVEHARSYVQDFLDATYAPDRTLAVARVLHALLPAPARPTLADMTEDERAACQWMQADVKGRLDRWAITRHFGEGGDVEAVSESGQISWFPPHRVIPRPDLPRMEWPGDQNPAPALPDGWRLADHPRYGRVLVTTPEPDCDGDLWFIDPSAEPGSMEHWCDPDVLTFLNEQGADQ